VIVVAGEVREKKKKKKRKKLGEEVCMRGEGEGKKKIGKKKIGAGVREKLGVLFSF
jgi:hypothetical protein